MFKLKAYSHVVVCRWIGTPQLGDTTEIFKHVKAAYLKTRRPIIYIGIHDMDSAEPGPAVRQEVFNGWTAGMEHAAKCYFVMASNSFVASIQTTLYRAMIGGGRRMGLKWLDKIVLIGSVDEVLATEREQLPASIETLKSIMVADGLLVQDPLESHA